MSEEINTLLTLQAVRTKAHRVFDLAKRNALNHFDYHPDRLDATVDYVISIIKVIIRPFHQNPPQN